MKNYALFMFFALLFLFVPYSYTQSKYGNATMDEMTMDVYPQDTTAAAVILTKIGNTRFVYNSHRGFQFEYTVQTKTKILKTEGLDWCDQKINYYESERSRKEEVRGLSGTTYNLENGKIQKVKLSKEHIFDEDVDGKWKVKKFTMPAAKVGSVIEFKYTIVSDFFWFLRDFSFQASIPIAYSKFDIAIPEYFRFNTNFQGYIKFDTKKEPANESFNIMYRDDNGRMQNTTVRCTAEQLVTEVRDVPAIRKESYMWTINDYISKVSFELNSIQYPYSMLKNFTTTWNDIDKNYMEAGYFGGNLKKTDLFKNEISKTEISLDRAREIQNIVKYKVKWDDKRSSIPKNLKDALNKGIGNSADLNFLLINALNAGGFDAFPVLLSTRSNGRMPITHPSEDAFNCVITGVQIDDTTTYFTDASAKYGDWNLLPTQCMVPQARAMRKGGSHWVDLSTITVSSGVKMANFEISDSKFKAKITETLKGNVANNARYSYSNSKDQNEFLESMSKRLGAEISDFKISNLEEPEKPLSMEYTQEQNINLDEDIIYINPMVEKVYSTNPFTEETRVYPVQFDYLMNYVQIVDIPIPSGFVIDEIPQSEKMVLNNNDAILTYRIVRSDKLIRVHYQYQLKKLLFLPTEYDSLKDFFSKLILKNSEMIVLKRAAVDNEG